VIASGMDERDGGLSCSTLYNTVVVIGPDGALLNRHRKLMPTNPERMVWGFGDASGLKVIDTPAGRIGTLDLLGKLHATSPLCLVRPGGGDLCGAHLPGNMSKVISPAWRLAPSTYGIQRVAGRAPFDRVAPGRTTGVLWASRAPSEGRFGAPFVDIADRRGSCRTVE